MIDNEKRRGVNVPASLSVFQVDQNRVDTNHTRTVLENVNIGCICDRCTHPTFQDLGSARFCYGHYGLLKLTDILQHLECDTTARIGTMQFSHPSSSDWPDSFGSLRCDNLECGATYLEKHTPVPLCKYCLHRAEKR
jgi:hypothetical protein